MPILIQVTEESNRQGTNNPPIDKLYGVPSMSLVRDNGTSATIILDGKRTNEERIVSETYTEIMNLIEPGYTDAFIDLNQTNGESLSLRAGKIVEIQADESGNSIVRYRDNEKQEDIQYIVTENFATILSLLPAGGGGGSQTLLQTLALGNVTGSNDIVISDDQTVEAVNGASYLDLRADSTDNNVELVGDNTGFKIFGSLGTAGFGNNVDATNDLTSEINISNFGAALFLANSNGAILKTGLVGLVYNQDFTWNIDADLPNYPSQMSTQMGTYTQGVVNSATVGGLHTVMKTDNTAYVNQIGFNASEAFETILDYTTATADNTITLQNASGTVAFLSDVQAADELSEVLADRKSVV